MIEDSERDSNSTRRSTAPTDLQVYVASNSPLRPPPNMFLFPGFQREDGVGGLLPWDDSP